MRRHLLRGFVLPLSTCLACDLFEVTNPGPIPDDDLNRPETHEALVNGAGRALSDGLNWIAHHGAIVTRELHPAALNQIFSVSLRTSQGILDPDEQGPPWNLAQRARWVAEDGVRRLRQQLGAEFSSSLLAAQVLVWAGYANRLLGENMCEAVIDGGSAQPREVFFTRALEHFTDAINVAVASGDPDLALAARAGRASVRVHLADWSGAVADAREVPSEFAYAVPYYDTGDRDLYNRIAHAGEMQPYRTHSVWGTKYEEYFLATADVRTPWLDTGQPVQGGALPCCGVIPFYQQTKYATRTAPIRLSSGREMRLIEAENQLRSGDLTGALALINAIRQDVQAPPVSAASLEEGWSLLKRERGIELWLEGRRLGDFYRWNQESTPGALDPREIPSEASSLTQQDLCFPIPTSERQTNRNL